MKLLRILLISIIAISITKPQNSYAGAILIDSLHENVNHRPLSGDEILLTYRDKLNEDAKLHREYLEKYYDNILKTIMGIGLFISALLGFFGFKSRKDIKVHVEELYERNSKEIIEKFLSDRTMEIAQRLHKLEDSLKHQIDVNLRQEKNIRMHDQFDQELVNDIKSKNKLPDIYRVISSTTYLEYETSKGDSVVYKKDQEIIGTSETQEVKFSKETILLGEEAHIERIRVNGNAEITNKKSKCEILLHFNPGLKSGRPSVNNVINCVLKNNFMNNSEWWEISQLYKCDKEIFVLVLPKSRPVSQLWVEEMSIGENASFEKIESNVTQKQEEDKIEYTVSLPATDDAMRYRVYWEFK